MESGGYSVGRWCEYCDFFVNITEQESQWFVPSCVSFLGFWVILLIVFGFWCKGIGV